MGVRSFSLLMMAGFSAALGLAIISPFLPELAASHGANGFWIGMIFAGFAISRGIVTPFIGRISDRVGRKIFVVAGLALYSAISLCYTRADNVYLLTMVRMAHGLSAGMILPIVMAYVGELARQGKEGLTVGALNTVLHLGVAVGPLIGGELAERYGFDAVFYAMAALGAVTLVLVAVFLPEAKGTTVRKTTEVVPFATLLKSHYVKAVLIMALASAALVAVFISFLPSVAVRDQVDMIHIGFIISVALLVAGILQIPFGTIAERLDAIGKLFQSAAGMAVSMLAIFVLPLCPDYGALFLAGSFLGLGLGVCTPALFSVSVDIGREVGMGSWMGIFWAVMSAGLVSAPILAGIIMDHLGIDAVFYSTALAAFFITLTSIYYVRSRRT